MIRIITKRSPLGAPEEWSDYPQRQADEVTPLLGLRFDRELVELDDLSLSLGVKRWTEAAWRIQTFHAATIEKLRELAVEADSPDADGVELARLMAGEQFTEWLLAHPAYLLSKWVAVWAAVNLGGGRMTLREVLEIAERDVEDLDDELLDYLDTDAPEVVDQVGEA